MFKKIKSVAALVIALVALAPSNSNAQAVEEGKILVDVYYGFPNLYTSVFKAAYANSGTTEDVKIAGLGPLGLRGEYMVKDKFGVGVDIGYNSTTLTFKDKQEVYNNTTGVYDTKTYDYTFKTQKIGVMATMNYHFLNNDKVDAYGVFGAGYGNRSYTFSSTDPDYKTESVKGLIPVAMRIGAGMRYFFTDNIGANLALGFGQGGIVNAGVSMKF